MLENKIIELEIKVSYQEDLLQTLSDIIAAQQQQIDLLERTYTTINERVTSLASRIPDELSSAHEIPPHY